MSKFHIRLIAARIYAVALLAWVLYPLNKALFRYQVATGAILWGGGKGDSPPPPDYTPLAEASDKAADVAQQLGNRQMDQAQQQFDRELAVAQPVIDAQTKLEQQAYDQGNQNYQAFLTEGRPIQKTLAQIANGEVPAADQALQDQAAGQAIADTRAGTTQQMNQLVRTGARYGMTPAALAAIGNQGAVAEASASAANANAARTQAANQYYARLGDVYNTYAGEASQAPNFYSAGTQAGNSAVTNSNGVGAGLASGTAQGAATITGGQGQRLSGLGSILNSQTSSYNAGIQANAGGDTLGGVLGGLGGIAKGGGFKALI